MNNIIISIILSLCIQMAAAPICTIIKASEIIPPGLKELSREISVTLILMAIVWFVIKHNRELQERLKSKDEEIKDLNNEIKEIYKDEKVKR